MAVQAVCTRASGTSGLARVERVSGASGLAYTAGARTPCGSARSTEAGVVGVVMLKTRARGASHRWWYSADREHQKTLL